MNAKEQEAIAAGVIETIKRAVDPLKEKVAQLESEVAALKVTPKSLDYHGTWQRAALYNRHEGTTHKGAIWVCVAETSRGNEPGSSPDWQLATKAHAR